MACTECHTVNGSEKGNFITLDKAMHTVEISKQGKKAPSSCVSCHENQIKQRDCAGCHEQLIKRAREDEKWCAVCHTMTPAMSEKQLLDGINSKLSGTENEKLAVETAMARKQASYWSPMVAPYKVNIGSLSNKYEPCIFNHRHHVQSLMDRVKDNSLAGAFHTEDATMCVTCHHHSPPSKTPPKCGSCHGKDIDKAHPERPRLMAAFHLQCMSCHNDMKVARPRNTDCATCHKLRPEQGLSK